MKLVENHKVTQLTFIWSKSTIELPEQCVKAVQSSVVNLEAR